MLLLCAQRKLYSKGDTLAVHTSHFVVFFKYCAIILDYNNEYDASSLQRFVIVFDKLCWQFIGPHCYSCSGSPSYDRAIASCVQYPKKEMDSIKICFYIFFLSTDNILINFAVCAISFKRKFLKKKIHFKFPEISLFLYIGKIMRFCDSLLWKS